ncbi:MULTISPECIES: helix-turn-helix domain-containing protein [Providencia]|uniref:helix-turn-helix domain-containing protein n=1 Tax=Providencia TaxID=586 RepID=UPI0018C62FFE|nr:MULTISPECIES: helix-turn-helix transcriptional regulator [Providencia]MBG5891018.1 helix-turn-helix transcriptional regulator [Providencia rettgeri]WOB89295.1 helix-turn-helix transcriptional regulator [Providencia sp. PROV175]
MINESPKQTNFTTILLLPTKELRLERGIHQAQLAERIGKSPSSLAKIEAGKSPLTMDVFLAYCGALMVSPSAVMATAERYAALLSSKGWCILQSSLEDKDDDLLKASQEYYSSPGYKRRVNMNNIMPSALNGPIFYQNGNVDGLTVFMFALFPKCKQQQLEVIDQFPFQIN